MSGETPKWAKPALSSIRPSEYVPILAAGDSDAETGSFVLWVIEVGSERLSEDILMTNNSPTSQSTGSESPFAPGSCKCGVPKCNGHQIEPDGKIHIRNHPRGHLVIDPSKLKGF